MGVALPRDGRRRHAACERAALEISDCDEVVEPSEERWGYLGRLTDGFTLTGGPLCSPPGGAAVLLLISPGAAAARAPPRHLVSPRGSCRGGPVLVSPVPSPAASRTRSLAAPLAGGVSLLPSCRRPGPRHSPRPPAFWRRAALRSQSPCDSSLARPPHLISPATPSPPPFPLFPCPLPSRLPIFTRLSSS